MRRGVTLVECMLASAILGFVTLALFEGVSVATRINRKNPEVLAAEAIAWDAVWKRFNEDFDNLPLGTVRVKLGYGTAHQLMPERQLELSVPQRTNYTAPELIVTIGLSDETGFSSSPKAMKKITADVQWGPESGRWSLSDFGLCPQVLRGKMKRVN